MSGTFVTYREEKKFVEYLWLVNLMERERLEDLEVDWRIIVNLSSRLCVGGEDLSGPGQRQREGTCE